MELSFKDLKKREVINVADGSCLGNITDLTISFPSGVFTSIVVPGKRTNFFSFLFSKNEMIIERKKIQKIGSDVILVNLNCGDTCGDAIPANPKKPQPHCKPFCPPHDHSNNDISYGEGMGIDLTDY